MPLDPGKLADAVADAVSVPDPERATALIAAGYASYAKTAASCAGSPPIIPDAAVAELRDALFDTGKIPAVDPVTTAAAQAAAFSAFWTSPPVPFGPGAVTAAPAAALAALLLGLAATNAAPVAAGQPPTPRRVGEQLAAALHAWTSTSVIVTTPGVCAGPVV